MTQARDCLAVLKRLQRVKVQPCFVVPTNSSSQLMLISTTTRLPTWHLVFSHEKHSTDGFSHWERCFCFSPEWLWQESKTQYNLKKKERKIIIQLGFDRLKVVFQIFFCFLFFGGVFVSQELTMNVSLSFH